MPARPKVRPALNRKCFQCYGDKVKRQFKNFPPPLMLAVWPLLSFFMTLFVVDCDCLLCSGFRLLLCVWAYNQLMVVPPPLMLAVWPLLNFFMTLFVVECDRLLCFRFSATPIFRGNQFAVNPPPLMLAVWPLLNFFMTSIVFDRECLLCFRFSASPAFDETKVEGLERVRNRQCASGK